MDGSFAPSEAQMPNSSELGVALPETVIANPRQQRKIVATLLTGSQAALSAPDVEVSNLEHDEFLKKVSTGEIGPTQVNKMLLGVNTSLGSDPKNQSPERKREVFYDVATNPKSLELLSYALHGDMSHKDNLGIFDIELFLDERPIPSDFKASIGNFLDDVGLKEGPEAKSQYQTSLTEMMEKIYGKRQEYSDQYDLLVKDIPNKPQSST